MEISNKIVLISVIALVSIFVVSAVIGSAITGEAARRRGGGGSCTDKDLDTYYSNCGTLRDCNDNNPNIKPGAIEICGNNIDDDCSNGDIGLCKASIKVVLTKTVYQDNEVVRLKWKNC